ncbi:MAG: IS66 family insertion sequence element accessory protein TnpB [Planctomycetota bacterium]
MTHETIREGPHLGYLFVFFNRRHHRTQVLFCDRSGFCLYCSKGCVPILGA